MRRKKIHYYPYVHISCAPYGHRTFLKPYQSAWSRLGFLETGKVLFKSLSRVTVYKDSRVLKEEKYDFCKRLNSLLQSWYCESPRDQATLFSRSFQTSLCGFMKGFQSMKTITKCLSFFKAMLFPSVLICWKTFPLGNVVTYLYCNDLFMFSVQDFLLHGHKPLSSALHRGVRVIQTIGDFHTNVG